jgi:hypothetical protein
MNQTIIAADITPGFRFRNLMVGDRTLLTVESVLDNSVMYSIAGSDKLNLTTVESIVTNINAGLLERARRRPLRAVAA